MKKYENYKDSGIEWIGKIPEHWKISKIGYLASKIGDGLHGTPIYVEDSEYSFVNGNNIGNGFLSITEQTKKVSEEEYLKNIKTLSDTTILMSINGTIGNLAYYKNEKVILGKSIAYINCNFDVSKEFIYYYLLSKVNNTYIERELSGSTIKNLSLHSINKNPLSIPPKYEQTQIANYLDHKTSQIDTLISKKEQFISLLQEELIVLINQAVTKGLDTKVKMKGCGIEWLGKIPEHWEEARVKNVANIIGRIGFRGYTTDDLVPKGQGAISLSPSNIKNHVLNIDKCTYLSWEKYNESPEIKIFENDIILVKTGSTIGKTSIIPSGTPEMTLNPQLVVLKDIKLNPLFLYYMMISNYFQGYFSIYTAGGSTPAISQEKINNFKITFPETEEQIKISNFIAKKEIEIKSIISKTQQEIELLKEYKTALISEVVTGKIDVREEILN